MIFFSSSYPIIRYDNTGSYDNSGKYIPGENTPDTIQADCQPEDTNNDLESAITGRKNLGRIKIYTDEILNVADETTGQNGDIIEFDGDDYEIISKGKRSTLIPHNKYYGELRKNDNIN